MDEIMKIALIPLVAGTIWAAGLAWWALSWASEGYGLTVRLIRSAKG